LTLAWTIGLSNGVCVARRGQPCHTGSHHRCLGRDRVDRIGLALEGRLDEGHAKSACVSPSGITDIMTRTLAERPSQKFGQQFIVDNRTGGGLLWTVATAIGSYRVMCMIA
jgi:hypothetical protein